MKDRCFLAVALCGMALLSGSCRKAKSGDAAAAGPLPVIASELQSNGLGLLPGAVYRSQTDSPIHWQAWTKTSLRRAKDAQRLVFCVIAMPQQPWFQKVLASLACNPAVVASINDRYVPILIDGDAAREIGLLTADWCESIQCPLQLPMFMWMTYEGNPVAWIPVVSPDPASVAGLFDQSHTMVTKMWEDEPDYVLKNSTLDNAARRKRLEQRKVSKVISEQPAVDVVRSLRHLAALYDSYSRSFDEAGGLFPSGTLELLATAAVHPGLPADVRARALETTRELLLDLLPSAMFDPLDGGVFSSRRGLSWSLPSFNRDCPGQARVAVALLQAYRATGDPKALEKALDLISFAEKTYVTGEGLFAVGLTKEPVPEEWMWSMEDIEKALKPADATWWIKVTGMKGLGNLPFETDPQRQFFRHNTVGLTQSLAEIAAGQAQSVEAFAPRFEAVKSQLLAVRNARLGKTQHDESSHAGATFRMVSAYAAAFGVTGDERYRDKAVALLKRAREAFSVEPRLRVFSKDAPDSLGAGRAFLYALALQAVIDVASITSDEQWLIWAEDLATTAAELFTGNAFLKECPDEAQLIDLPATDLVMLFDDSTAGLLSLAECRLAEIGRPLVVSFSELATPMPAYAMERPVLHTDLLLATLARHYKVTVVPGADISPALKLATERLPMRVMPRRPARPADQVPTGSVKVLLSEGQSRIVATPEALQEAVLPSPEK
jgi:uncharacterized protein YyaL (SSP411 family)